MSAKWKLRTSMASGVAIAVVTGLAVQWWDIPQSEFRPLMRYGVLTKMPIPGNEIAYFDLAFMGESLVRYHASVRMSVAQSPLGPERVDHAFIDAVIREAEQQKQRNEAGSSPGFDRCIILEMFRAGWPFRSFEASTAREDFPGSARWSHGSISVGPEVKIAFRPIWYGLIGNTAFFAAMVMVVLTLVGTRADRRRRRGCCEKCGYDRRGLAADPVCPECGRGVESASARISVTP